MTKISIMYYIDGLTQQEISQQLGISRPQISRMINSARSEGIVSITVKDAFAEERRYEQWLCRQFGLPNAVVVDAPDGDLKTTPRIVAGSTREILEATLRDQDVVGVSAGNTVGAISEEFQSLPRKKLSVVPLVGGIGSSGTGWQANSNARRLAENCDAHCWQLNAPMLVATAQAYEILYREPEIAKVLDIARHCTLVVTGIGQFSNDATILKTGFLSDGDIRELTDKGAVASVCSSFLDRNGRSIACEADARMIGLTVGDLAKVPKVIAVAWGAEKVEAIASALKGGWIHTLITTFPTAKLLHTFMGGAAQGL